MKDSEGSRLGLLPGAGILLSAILWANGAGLDERVLPPAPTGRNPVTFQAEVGASGQFTWWLPPQAEELILPLCAGIAINTTNTELMSWLGRRSPWPLAQLPVLGARYGERMMVVIVPWPHYAELIAEPRVGIRFTFPRNREKATPCEVVVTWCGADPLEPARAFRTWRQSALDTGAIPKPRPLSVKAAQLPRVSRLFGAPHLYLWGPALFCRHDVDRRQWIPFARWLLSAPEDSLVWRAVRQFSPAQQRALSALAKADWPLNDLTLEVAAGLERVLTDAALLNLSPGTPLAEVVRRNRETMGAACSNYVHAPDTWGDGLSSPMLEALREAGIQHALLLRSDLYEHSPRPELAALAEAHGFLLGPYDSYHSVHNPAAHSDQTWETAQFDEAAYVHGRVLNVDGTGHRGFRGAGYHFSPLAAWPYVQKRVGSILRQTPYSAWFIDCDATAECFDDYNPRHLATRLQDLNARRQRLHWLESKQGLVVGSEDGSALFADLLHFGHGIHTPYLGHLDPAFKDPSSPHFLGRHWPPDTPAVSFKAVPVPPSLRSPFFDPRVRIPLYQAALGDELITTHHWSFDSFKFSDLAATRELMEILYQVPPLYHLSRESWPTRRDRVRRHLAFWAPLHRALAPVRLTHFECLSPDRLVQRTTFELGGGQITITVNFGAVPFENYPGLSATVAGPLQLARRVYRVEPSEALDH